MLSAQGMKKTLTHNLHSGSAKNILGTVSLETVTVTFKEGEVLSPHRTDQTRDTHLLTQSTDQCLEVTIQMIPLSLRDQLVIERTPSSLQGQRMSQCEKMFGYQNS